MYAVPVGKRYKRVTYSEHAKRELERRPYMDKALVERALREGVHGVAENGALTADVALPNKDTLALRVVYYEATVESAFVVTLYPVSKRRTNL